MYRKTWSRIACCLLVFLVAMTAWSGFAESEDAGRILTAENPDRSFEMGTKTSMNGISVVDLHGTWHEMGRQYGALLKDELEEVYLYVETIIQYSVGNAEKADSIIAVQTAQTPYRICEFIRGAAETSGLTVEQLQAVNAVERIGGLPKCSAVICWDDYASGPLVVGRNYDYSEAFALLKDEFTKDDLYVVCKREGIKTKLSQIIWQWKNGKHIEVIEKNKRFRKIQKNETK